MKISIVATLYQSASYINEFYLRASAAAKKLVDDGYYEIVFVNDGYSDSSLDIPVQLTESDSHVVVDLSRNFGHHKAMMVGLANASGQRMFLIDSDLEEEPEWLSAMHLLHHYPLVIRQL